MACAWVTSVGHHLHHPADVIGTVGGPERVDRADPSYIGLVGVHPDPRGATSDVGRVWRVGDVIIAGVLMVAVALQEMRRVAGEDALLVRLGLRLPVPKHPMYATSAAVYGAFSGKPAVPTLVGCPSWRSRCSMTFTG